MSAALLFPLLGIIFAFVVATDFAMSGRRGMEPGYFGGVLLLAAMIGGARDSAGLGAWLF